MPQLSCLVLLQSLVFTLLSIHLTPHLECLILVLSACDITKSPVRPNERRDLTPASTSGPAVIALEQTDEPTLLVPPPVPSVPAPVIAGAPSASSPEQLKAARVEAARLEAERARLKATPPRHSAVVWIQLNLWPLVLLAALSLKFAKGAATLRKARKSAA